jgi:molecular chaperone GrpE
MSICEENIDEKKERNNQEVNNQDESKIDEKDDLNKLEKDIEEITKKLNEQENKSQEYLSLLQRTQADFQNYKKRITKETEDYAFINIQKILVEFLNFRNTLKQAYDKETNNDFKENILQLLNNYENILKRQNIIKINCLNKDFDYNYCECVCRTKVDDKKKHNKVIEVLEDGYLLNNKLITPAKVVVGIMEE